MSAFDRSWRPTLFALAVATGLYVYLWGWFGKDLPNYLVPWFEHIRATGPIAAFAHPFGNYTPPYLYLLATATLAAPLADPISLIKLLSIAGTFALVAAVWRLLAALDVMHPGRKAMIVFALPTVVLNAGLLGQCDAIWAAASVMALAAAVKRHHAMMLAWCGLALAIKLQPAFSAPIILALLIGRRVPFRLWPIAPAAFVTAMLPAWLLGWPAADLATIYLHQADWSPLLSLNAPNIWVIAQALPLVGDLPLSGLAIAAATGASAWLIARFSWRAPEREQLLAAALLVTLITVGLLPRMHERYFFLADILALVLAFVRNDRHSWRIAGLVQLASLAGLLAYLSGVTALAVLGALPMIAATLLLGRQFLVSPANDNGLPLNPFRAYPA
ncbi:hypothetical protein [Sphingomonas asaccharolytica]|uniref:hypothetical protein n=1 Tax=Sphingomonas asaccharolytica TaxID=40681 RepID=UPI0008350739|nr:hypothetical protein [Sphingomonas asaccharolytica]